MDTEPLQGRMFHEDFYDALRDVVKALGGNKKVGAEMQPEKPADQAGRWLANALDNGRPEKLDPEQVMYLLQKGRQIGCHIAMHYITGECGYQDPQPIEPKDEEAELMRQFIKTGEDMKRLMSQINRVQMRAVGEP